MSRIPGEGTHNAMESAGMDGLLDKGQSVSKISQGISEELTNQKCLVLQTVAYRCWIRWNDQGFSLENWLLRKEVPLHIFRQIASKASLTIAEKQHLGFYF